MWPNFEALKPMVPLGKMMMKPVRGFLGCALILDQSFSCFLMKSDLLEWHQPIHSKEATHHQGARVALGCQTKGAEKDRWRHDVVNLELRLRTTRSMSGFSAWFTTLQSLQNHSFFRLRNSLPGMGLAPSSATLEAHAA